MGTIHVDYANAKAQAKKLHEIASNCDEVIRQLRTAINDVPQYWVGVSADAFVLSVQARIREITSVKDRAAATATQIDRIVNELQEAERRLQEEMAAQKSGLVIYEDTISLSPSDSSGGGGGFR